MRFLLLLTISLVELATTVGKWLFIVSAPVLLIVAGSYYQAGKSSFEPLVGLTLVAVVFGGVRLTAAKLEGIRALCCGNNVNVQQAKVDPINEDAEIWIMPFEEESWKQVTAQEKTCRRLRLRAELWKQANPWGGYNPFD